MIDLHKIHFPDFCYIEWERYQALFKDIQTEVIKNFSEKADLCKEKYGYKINEDFETMSEEIVIDGANEILDGMYRPVFDLGEVAPKLFKAAGDKTFNITNKWEEKAIAAESEAHRQNRAITVLEGISDNCKYIGDGIQDVNDSVKEVKESIDSLSDSVASSNYELHRMTNVMAYKRRLF